jgi:glycosyltransferase involved in cell wall biosynthesis
MKIVHVVEAWKGGIATYTNALIESQLNQGHEVCLLADSKQLEGYFNPLLTLKNYTASRNPVSFFSIAKQIKNEILLFDADVVHCHSTFAGVYVRMNKHACKIVYTPHCWSFLMRDISFLKRFLYERVELFLSKNTNKIVCMSFEEVSAAKKVGIDTNIIELIHTGIPNVRSINSSEIEKSNNCPNLIVGFFGRFDTQKGFDVIENCANNLNENVEIHLFGDFVRGSGRDLNSRLIQHGWLNHEDIPTKMADVDIVIIPSRWEGFAITPLEAMRAAKPIIISNESSLPEVVIHRYNGIIMSDLNGQTLANIINSLSKEQCIGMGVNAFQVYTSVFGFEIFIQNMNKVYFDL